MLSERLPPRSLILPFAPWVALLSCIPVAVACGGPLPGPAPFSGGTTSFDGFGGTGGFSTDLGAGAVGGFGGSGTGSSFGAGAVGSCGTGDLSVINVRAHRLDPWMPLDRVHYAWMTPAEEEGLREGGPLLHEHEAGQVETHGAEQFAAWALGHPDGIEAAIAPNFEAWRSVWPHPWPIRLGIEGEDPGSRLVRLELANEAWIARVAEHGAIWQVYDLQGNEVALDVARGTPERVALLYYVYLGEGASELCGPIDRQVPGPGYRQFIIGNRQMILSYELGTERLLTELEWNIDALYGYLDAIRPCPPALFDPFEANVICQWGYHFDPFLDSLASAGPAFEPTPTKVADLIELLEDSLFELNPFVAPDSDDP